ncbi:putative porin [Winogradskyella sp.]|uniref:putative porin n=1 Tax=Winogradskyella sp. TaxID=1883156 RepID=UPI003F6BB878
MSNKSNLFFVSLLFLSIGLLNAQTKLNRTSGKVARNPLGNDSSTTKRAKGFEKLATIDMYLIIDDNKDSIQVDTSLTIKKEYKFNYLQRDEFGLIPFANIGQTYNSLSYNFNTQDIIPSFGAQARHFNYMNQNDIKYFEVPTPWTRLTYKTAFEQGQMLDAAFAVNLSKQFNFSLAYKGLRSLGNYQNALTSSGNFRFTTNFKTKNNRYKIIGHIVMQDILNQENGGLQDEDLENFESGDEEFIDRSVFDMNFEDAENILVGKRFYLNHSYSILNEKDSLNTNTLKVFNELVYEDKYYQFYKDSQSTEYFGESFTNDINDKVSLENFKTTVGANYSNKTLGRLSLGINYSDLNYGYNSVVLLQDEIIPNRIKQSFASVDAKYANTISIFNVYGEAGLNLSSEFKGRFISTEISARINSDISLSGKINISSKLPNLNYLLYQSDYINYNWYNLDDYDTVNLQQLKFDIESEKYLNANIEINNIDNYTYFNLETVNNENRIIKPRQYKSSIQYLKVTAKKEFRIGNFALDNKVMFQNVISDEEVLNLPSLVTRNTLYYTDQIFKKAMTFQTGIVFNYFTKYNMNGYDPLLAEFYTQNETELGGFPRFDFFINAKIRQTRIFLKAEHFNSSFTGFNYFSAPNHPYRDFTVRFGLVWDFFL